MAFVPAVEIQSNRRNSLCWLEGSKIIKKCFFFFETFRTSFLLDTDSRIPVFKLQEAFVQSLRIVKVGPFQKIAVLKIMAPFKEGIGNGAVVSVFAKFVQPKRFIKDKFPNYRPNKRFECVVNGCGVENNHIVLYFSCEEITNRTIGDDQPPPRLYAFHGHFTIVRPCHDLEQYIRVPDPTELQENRGAEEVNAPEFHGELLRLVQENAPYPQIDDYGILADIEIDDDNLPAPENVPTVAAVINNQGPVVYRGDWGHSGVCNRRATSSADFFPSFPKHPSANKSLIDLFEILFPVAYLEDVVIENINKRLDDNQPPVKYGEFLRFLGIFFLLSCHQGGERKHYWSTDPITHQSAAPIRVNEYMSKNRFNLILSLMDFTTGDPPGHRDKFWSIRLLLHAWNSNMDQNFSAGWISCLDESMMAWTAKYSCPGFMYVPRKPHPFGNEFHTIGCGVSGVLYRMEIVEGKDQPAQHVPQFSEKGKTAGLLLRLTKPIHSTGRVVVLDSGFCVLQAIHSLAMVGVFASAMIKKRRYWPKHIDGEMIKTTFNNKPVGFADSIGGQYDGRPFDVFCMKDVSWTTMLMSTYGTNQPKGEEQKRKVNNREVRFRYPEVVANHYLYRGVIDKHNQRRHYPIPFEKRWGTKRWDHRVFGFVLAVTEINILLADAFLKRESPMATDDFRRLFALALINNKHYSPKISPEVDCCLASARKRRRSGNESEHAYISLPAWHKFNKFGQIVQAESRYPQATCFGTNCQEKTRSYCRCNPGKLLCKECYRKH